MVCEAATNRSDPVGYRILLSVAGVYVFDMDRRRFLLGSATGATLGLAGCTRSELEAAQRIADGAGDESKPASKSETQTSDSETDGNANGDGAIGVEEGAGLVTVDSTQSFEATVDRITTAIENNDALTLVTIVDHAANAESVGLSLPPTTVLVFGNPNLGTPLMQASRSVAIDLPQKLLVWEENGSVYVSYNDPEYLAARHGIEDMDETLSTIAGALESLATGQSGN
jgi:uncharacterized protein (DUF302 family)